MLGRAGPAAVRDTHNNGVHSNSGAWGAMQALKDPDNNIGVWLQNTGYRTAYVGKYLNGYETWRDTHPTPDGWDRFDATVEWIYECGTCLLTVRYYGADKDVTAGTRSPPFTVRVR